MAYRNDTGLPSPSSVLRPWIDSTYFTDESRDRGQQVHAACSTDILGGFATIDRQYRGYLDSFKRWCDQEKPKPVIHDGEPLIERRLISTHYGYCGQPDLPCYIASHLGIVVADLKTSAALGRAWPLQIAAYRELVKGTTGQHVAHGASIRLREDGRMPLVEFYETFDTDLNTFFGCLNAWRHFNRGQ